MWHGVRPGIRKRDRVPRGGEPGGAEWGRGILAAHNGHKTLGREDTHAEFLLFLCDVLCDPPPPTPGTATSRRLTLRT